MIFKKDHNLLKKDTWLKNFFYPRKTFWFDNLQDYSSDGSSNDAYNIFFYAFWGVSFVATVLWVLIFALLFSLIFFDKNIKMNPFIDIIGSILSIYPIDIIILIFIISSICMYRPMQKIKPMQNQKSIQKNFYFSRFFSVILIWFILFFGFSLNFDIMSSNSNPKEGCDICGGPVAYEYSVNGEVIHSYCTLHALYWAFFNPITVILHPPTGRDIGDDGLVLMGALASVFTWLFAIGFAFILGSGYTWEENWERNFLKSIEYKIKKHYFDIQNTVKEFFEIYRNE